MANLKGSLQDLDKQAFALDVNSDVARLITGTVALTGNVSNITKTIFNISITSSNTEFSQALPASTKGYEIQIRSGVHTLKLTHVSGESGTKFVTIPAGATHSDDHFYTSDTIYFQSTTSGGVVELITYS